MEEEDPNWNQMTEAHMKTRRRTLTSVDVDAFTILTARCDLELFWPSESNQVIGMGYWIFHVSFIEAAQAIHEISW